MTSSVFTAAALANAPAGGGGGSDPLLNQVPGTYASGTAGAALGRLTGADHRDGGPVASGGSVSVIQGDSYYAADGRALLWTNSAGSWPSLVGATVTLTTRSGFTAPVTVVVASGPGQQVQLELTGAQTAGMASGTYGYLIRASLASGHAVTLVDAQWNAAAY